MGLYSEQIASRIKNDQDAFELSFVQLASVVMGHKRQAETFLSDRETAKNAIEEILKYYHVVPAILPDTIEAVDDQLEFFLHPAGIMRRRVELTGKWYKDGIGPLLAQTESGQVISLLPGKASGYTYYDHEQNKRIKVNKENSKRIRIDAYCFYNPFPNRKIKIRDLLIYMARTLAISDYVVIISTIMAVTLLGLLIPYANQQIFSNVIPFGGVRQLMAISFLLVGATISTMLIRVTQNVVQARITTKTDIAVQSAAMSRLLSLPAIFFKEYTTGEISQRLQYLSLLCSTLIQIIFGAGLSGLFSFVYMGQIAVMTPALAVPAFIITATNLALTVTNALVSVKIQKKQMQGAAKLNGLVFSLLSGVQKIKISGSERRAFSKWAEKYSENASLSFAPPVFMRVATVLMGTVTTVGTIILFSISASAGISVAEYMAFIAAYGLLAGAIMSLAAASCTGASIKPILDLAKPIMDIEPETSVGKKMITRLSGSIDINNVSFRYNDDMPFVLDDLSLRINRGQYVAVVGASGCGKSTLLRLLLGFEEPHKGAIYYDSNDMKSIDVKSLRRSMGCVIQNSKLMTGSIYENIVVSAPWLTINEAWEAAEMAGVADDIRQMPMGMHTLVSDGGGGLSGGQKQRLIIARALAPKPKILLLDEATSALDNITQKHVSQTLDSLKCTRIVIAHRLSTIRQCDRVIMLEKGRIVEDGTYDELVKLNGKFAQLVKRQQLDIK